MLIYKFTKNALEEIRVEVTEYQGTGYISLRIWFDNSRGQDTDWRPSPRGLTINVDLLQELRKGIDLAIKFLGNEKILANSDHPTSEKEEGE